MAKNQNSEIKVGIFLTSGILLLMLSILLLGTNQKIFGGKVFYTAHFKNVEGLITGAKVILGGVPVGTVDSIDFDPKAHDIAVKLSVSEESKDWIRQGSTLEISTQGVLGDKYVNINEGPTDEPPLPPGSDIPNRPGKDFSALIGDSDHLMRSLTSIAASLNRILQDFEGNNRSEILFKGLAETSKNLSLLSDKVNRQMDDLQLKKAINSVSQIFEKINNGTGTLGALINDPSLYDELKALTGGANRNRIIRNLVRQTIKGYEESSESRENSSSGKP